MDLKSYSLATAFTEGSYIPTPRETDSFYFSAGRKCCVIFSQIFFKKITGKSFTAHDCASGERKLSGIFSFNS